MSRGRISDRAAVGIAIIGIASLVSGFGAAIFGEPSPTVRSADPDSFSRSALGHRAFVELLRESGRRVAVSRSRSAERAIREGVLVLLEPPAEPELLREMLAGVERALIALPKREAFAEAGDRGYVDAVAMFDLESPQSVLDAVGIDGTVTRPETAFTTIVPGSPEPPRLVSPQLVVSATIEPVLASADGVLLGRSQLDDGSERWLISDPDLFENHGLADGVNADVVLALIDRIAGGGDLLVIDETLHGHEVAPHVWGALGRFPLVLAVVQALAALTLLLWLASRRFGSPLPEESALESGRMQLVDSTAELLVHGGHSPAILARYLAIEELRVAHGCNIPRRLDADERREALRGIERRRKPSQRFDEITAIVDRAGEEHTGRDARILVAARRIHRWRTEMLHGAE